MRAVVMAGGEGTRLRPMTANQPKPLVPVANRPLMEHVLRLLDRHGFDETVVTVQFLASLVRTYFGDGEELGMHLSYATEQAPLGTAGSVRNAAAALRDETFLVMSGDALTDIDLTAAVAAHRDSGALVTVCLARVPDPVEFGTVVTDDESRVLRLLEKPGWGQVLSDTVNTGIYVMEPEVLDAVPAGQAADWAGDVLPALIARGALVHGHVTDGYWQDVGSRESYVRANSDVLEGRVDVEIDGFEVSPGIWVGQGAELDPDAEVVGPVLLGRNCRVAAGARVLSHTVLGSNVVLEPGAVVERSVVHDNVFVGPQAQLRGCVVGKNVDIMRAARLDEGVVVGDECVVEEEAWLSSDVLVYPFKSIEAGAVVHTGVIWESRGTSSLWGPRGVSGLVNVELTPELAVRFATAYASTLEKGAVVTTCRDASRASRAFQRAVTGALTACGLDVRDLEVVPLPVMRFATATSEAAGGIALRTSPQDPQSLDVVVLDERGADLPGPQRRRVERVLSRQEFRRAFPGEIGELTFPARTVETYVHELLEAVDVRGVPEAGLKVVVDAAGGAASLALPVLLGRLDVDVLTVGNRLDAQRTSETEADHLRDLERLGELVASSRADFGVRFDHVAERLSLVDDRGHLVHDDRALLVVMDLVAAERHGGLVALPVTTTRVAEQVTRFHGCGTTWTTTSPDDLTRASALPGVVFAGDGRGGFVVPELSGALDALAAFVRLLGLVARTRLSLSGIDARIPPAHVLRREVTTPWASKGAVMRAVLEHAGDREVDTTDGVRVVDGEDRWAMVLPDPQTARTLLWAEGPTAGTAQALLDSWAAVVDEAARPGR